MAITVEYNEVKRLLFKSKFQAWAKQKSDRCTKILQFLKYERLSKKNKEQVNSLTQYINMFGLYVSITCCNSIIFLVIYFFVFTLIIYNTYIKCNLINYLLNKTNCRMIRRRAFEKIMLVVVVYNLICTTTSIIKKNCFNFYKKKIPYITDELADEFRFRENRTGNFITHIRRSKFI